MPEKMLINPENNFEWTVSYDDGDKFLMIMTKKNGKIAGNTHSLTKYDNPEVVYNKLIKDKLKEGYIDPDAVEEKPVKKKTKLKTEKQISPAEMKEWWDGLERKWQIIFKEVFDIPGKLSDDHFRLIFNCEDLDLSGQSITHIKPLELLTSLTSLNLTETQITDISPLKNHGKLIFLELSNCAELENIAALSHLESLENLDISFTSVKEITCLKSLKNLQRLVVEGLENEVDNLGDQIRELRKSIPDCRVVRNT